MATIGHVTDLTKRKGKLIPVGNSSIELNKAKMPHPFLKEVKLSNSKCCYFSHNLNIDPTIEHHFEIGLINIPKGFQFVEYSTAGATEPNWENKKEALNKTIYTPILLNISHTPSEARTSFHICENINPMEGGGQLHEKTYQGCSQPLVSNNGDTEYPFVLFYYFGKLYFSSDEFADPEDYEKEITPQGYYLIPLALSERLTVYYVIPEDESGTHKEILNLLKEKLPAYLNQQTGNYSIGILERLQLNDKLGIFVTRQLLDLP
jgi:hypothetical protein